jgi:biotin carboxylase
MLFRYAESSREYWSKMFSQDKTPFTVRNIVMIGFWSPCLAFARRMKEAGVAVHLIDMVDEPASFERHSAAIEADGEIMLWSDAKSEKAILQIQNFAKRVKADAIVTADEFTQLWLAENRHRFEPACRVLAPSAATLQVLLKKPEQVRIAREAGFNLLPNWELFTAADAAQIPADSFPVCVRPGAPDSVQPMFKAMVLDTPQALEQFLAGIQWQGSPLLVQPYCFGPNIVVHGVADQSGRMIALRAYLAYRKSRGFAVSLRSMRLSTEMRTACVNFVQASKITGPFHFDLLQSAQSGRIYFLEVNVRLGGTTAKVIRMGYDEPMLMLKSFGISTPVDVPLPGKFQQNVTGKRLALAHLVDALCKRKDPLSYPQKSWTSDVFSALWEAITVPDVLFNLRDVRGSLWYMLRVNRPAKPAAQKSAM